MLSNFAMFLLEDKQYNGEEYTHNTILIFLSGFKTVLCKNQKFQIFQEIKEINVKNTHIWYSDI